MMIMKKLPTMKRWLQKASKKAQKCQKIQPESIEILKFKPLQTVSLLSSYKHNGRYWKQVKHEEKHQK